MEETLRKFMVKFAKRHDENSNLIKEIQASTDAAIRYQVGSIKASEIQIGQISKFKKFQVCSNESATSIKRLLGEKWRIEEEIKAKMNEHSSTIIKDGLPPKERDPWSFTLPCTINNMHFNKALADLGTSVSVMPYSTFTPIGIAENVLVGIDKFVFLVDFVIIDMPEDLKTPLILGRPFLSSAHAKIDVFKRKFDVRVGNDILVFKSNNPTNHIVMKVYALGLRERMGLDLEARLMGEALFLNRSRDPEFRYYIELNDLNEPLELRNHENEDLGPTIDDGEVIDELNDEIVETRNDNVMVEKIDEYPSLCDYDRKINDNCAYNLRFSCMIGYEHVDANFFPILSINVMSKKIYNSIMKDKIKYKGKNVIGAFINVPIFIRDFSVITDFVVVENMDNYRDEGMGDIIVGKSFCREVCVDARRSDGLITIYNGNSSVTYQMAMTHPWFKHLSNEQCNKIWPLLKVSARDKLEGRSHPYQKLKSFYKGVLNLGPEYIKDEKTVEWLTRGHVSVHEME
ncbi:homeodomain-like protein [Tanacetum coccineum]